MEGSVLHFSFEAGEGVIRGRDGQRYTFASSQWLSSPGPAAGDAVDFEIDGSTAQQIYRLAGAGPAHGSVAAGPSSEAPPIQPPQSELEPFRGSKPSVVAASLMIVSTLLPWISVPFGGSANMWTITDFLRMAAGFGSYGPARGGVGGTSLIVYLFLLPFYLIPFFAGGLIYKEAKGTATPGSRSRVGLYGLFAPWVMVFLAYMIIASASPRGAGAGIGNPLAILSIISWGWYLLMGCGIALIVIASGSAADAEYAPYEEPAPVSAAPPIPPPAPAMEESAIPAPAAVWKEASPSHAAEGWAYEESPAGRTVAIVAGVVVLVLVAVAILIAASSGRGSAASNFAAGTDRAVAPAPDTGTVMAQAAPFTVTSSSIDATPDSGGPATVRETFYYSGAVVGSGFTCGLGNAPQQSGTLQTEAGWVTCTWRDVPPGEVVGSLSAGGITAPTRELIIPAAPPPAAAPVSLESQAQQFAQAYFATWSGADSDALAFLDGAYAGSVIYYGRDVPPAAVMREKRAFVERWPERNYTLDPSTTSVACNRASRRCTVSGNVSFRCHSQLRNETSSGVAVFSLEILFPEIGRPVILTESSRMLSRVRS